MHQAIYLSIQGAKCFGDIAQCTSDKIKMQSDKSHIGLSEDRSRPYSFQLLFDGIKAANVPLLGISYLSTTQNKQKNEVASHFYCFTIGCTMHC